MGSEHSKTALQQNFPIAYNKIKDIFLYHYPCGKLVYTLQQINDDIVFTVIAGARKGGVSYNKEELYYKQALLYKEYTRAWSACEWLTKIPVHLKKNIMTLILHKKIVEFKNQAWGIEIASDKIKHASSVADAFTKTRENFDNITKASYGCNISI